MRLPVLIALAAFVTVPAFAQTSATPPTGAPSSAQTAQRERMTTCNATAKTQKMAGDARKTFMADCLAGKSATAPVAGEKPMTTQQTKMKTCNADASAKSLKGQDRRAFMSTCLKG